MTYVESGLTTVGRSGQKGAVLLVSLLILLLLAIIATTVSETNLLQLQMAGNDEAKASAMQRSLAVIESILSDGDNTPVIGDIGHKICDTGAPDPNSTCDTKAINIDSSLLPATGETDYYAVRVGPLATTVPVMNQNMASSSTAYKAAKFEVHASYDGTDEKLGRVKVVQGVMIRIAAGSQ